MAMFCGHPQRSALGSVNECFLKPRIVSGSGHSPWCLPILTLGCSYNEERQDASLVFCFSSQCSNIPSFFRRLTNQAVEPAGWHLACTDLFDGKREQRSWLHEDPQERRQTMLLRGFPAISYAEQEGLTLNKDADRIDESRAGLTVAEAEAIAAESPELIWLEVPADQYYGEPRNMEPGR
jgi:hypothetical protein